MRPVLFPLILALSFLSPMPGYAEVATNSYPDGAERTSLAPTATPRVQAQFLNLPMRFEANHGQTNPKVNFISRGSGYTLFLTPAEAALVLKEHGRSHGVEDRPSALRSGNEVPSRTAPRSLSVLRMKLVGANPSAKAKGLEELPGKTNYFIGDPSQWRTGIPSYKKVEYRDIYPGIHLIYYGNEHQLEYDFVAAPGADPERITLSFDGCEKVGISEGGDLVIGLAGGGEISFHKPHIYQEVKGIRRPIAGNYRLQPSGFKPSANAPTPLIRGFTSFFKNILGRLIPSLEPGMRAFVKQTVGFQIAAYDRNLPLVIDPTLSYSTYLGGASGDEYGYSIAVDSSGYAYVSGLTASTNFPTTSGAYQTANNGGGTNGYDIFVTKLATDGKSLVYSTYLGGTGDDYDGYSIAVDSSGYAYVAGYTASTNFPTTSGAYQTANKSSSSYNAFVTKLATDGKSLVYSTYLGGSSAKSYGDQASSIAVDSSGYAYVTGLTSSTDFPTTSGAYQTANKSSSYYNAFVTKLATDGKSLVYSTYLGGSFYDLGYSIAVNSSGNAYVAGETGSTDFPTTSGVYQTFNNSNSTDGFVTELANDGKSLVHSTYIGGGDADYLQYMALDSNGSAYVTGYSWSCCSGIYFPTTSGAYQTTPGGYYPWVTKFTSDFSNLVYSTYLRGSGGSDRAWSIAVDSNGYAYVTGATNSTDFPTTSGAVQTSLGGGIYDAYVTKLATDGKSLYYSTYLGGSARDVARSIALDSSGNAYVTGYTASTNFPTTTGAYQTSNKGGGSWGYDAFIFKLSGLPTLITLASFSVSPEQGDARIEWQTKSEVENLGFNLYRVSPDGTGSVKLNSALIPGLISSAIGRSYTYVDTGARAGTTVCYMLEDIDLHEESTYHGPACAYWPSPQGATQSQEGTTVQGTADVTGPGGHAAIGGSSTGAVASGAQGMPASTGAVTAVMMRSMTARKGPEGVLIEWQTGFEVRNLGFYVYRDGIRLNQELLMGSALMAGTHTILRSGNAYSWFDAGSRGGTYWVEDVDLSGKKTQHGPVTATPSEGPLPTKKTISLSQLPQGAVTAPFKAGRMLTGTGSDFPGGPSPLETQWALAGTHSLKVLIRQEGWYRLTFTQLAQVGFKAKRPQFIQLYVDGQEQPIVVTANGIEFYATGVDTQWTDTRVYWLVNGLAPGKRIDQAGGGSGPSGPVSFPATIEAKPRSFYFPALLNGEAQNFFGAMITPTEADITLQATQVTQGAASLELLLQGVTDSSHSIKVFLNGSWLGSVVFDGQTQGHALLPVAKSQLREGANQVSFISSGDSDVAAVDTLRLTYAHTYTADGDHLKCMAPGGTTLTLTGFTAPVRTFDITDPKMVKELPGQVVKGGIRLLVPGKGQRTLFAVTEAAIQAPQLTGNSPSDWHANHRADMVIITHEDFTESLAPLVQLRQRQGLSVAVVDIEDIYDEFSYGQKTPFAIKAFLARARNWRRAPRYVLLAGGATYDPRNYTNLGNLDFVPTKLLDTAMLETAVDGWFVDFNADGLPEIPIGRLPVNTAQEAATVVAKLIAYEQDSPSTKALYVADIGDQVGNFEGAIQPMESLISLVPEELFRSKLGGTTGPLLLAGLKGGAGLVTYLGHGSMQLWDDNVLDTSIVDTLTNTAFPFFISLTCLNGYFIMPTFDSLAGALVTDSGGAVGVVASSSLTEFAPQEALGSALLSHLSTGVTVGEALVAAQHAVSDPDVQKSYLLFGDPSMRVRR